MSLESSRVPVLAAFSIAGAVAAILGMARTANAQEAGALEEVVVTAEKRASDVQDVPIAISVVGGDELIKQGVTDLMQLTTVAPDLNVVENTIFTQFTIRGVGSQDIGELGDSAITIGIDGEYITRPVALNATMFDIERIEVLRGPQGTLYGRNATAGALNIIANKPHNEFAASVSLDVGDYSAINAQGTLNIPVSESLAFRAAAMSVQHDGYRNGGPAGDMDDQDVQAARLSMMFTPNDFFSWYLAGEYNTVDQTAPSQYGINIGAQAPVGFSPSDIDIPVPDDWDQATAGFFKTDQYAIRTQLDFDFAAMTLTYVGGYRDVEVEGYQPLNGFVPETFSFDNKFDIQNQSHELRLHGDSDRLFWQAGLYYGKEEQDVARGLFLPFLSGAFGAPPYLNFFLRDIESETQAAFAQATFNVTNAVRLTAGVRYTEDDKSRVGADTIPFTYFYPNHPTSFGDPNTIPLVGVPNDGNWSKVTWLAGVDWLLAEDNLLYAKVSTGYKAGGFDNVGQYDPEELTAYEIGSKNRFADGTLQLNVAAFYYDYTDQQTSVFISTEVGNAVQNAGKSEVTGVEIDSEWLATDADRISFSVYYLDAEFKDLPTSANRVGAPSVPVNLAGNRPVQSPEWTLALGYEHVWQFDPGELSFGVRSQYKSEYYLQPFNWVSDKQDDYTMTDANLTWTAATGAWDISAYVRNIEDERLKQFSAFTGNGIDIYNFIMGNPRTYGVQGNYYWGR